MNSTKRFSSLDGELLGNFTRFYILLLLFERERHGYEIISEMKRRLGQRASPSLVYPFLKELQKGKILGVRSERDGHRERREYFLTRGGKDLCLRLFGQFTEVVSSAIKPSMKSCSHCGCMVYKDSYIEEIKGKKLAFCCTYCADSYKAELGFKKDKGRDEIKFGN